MKMGTEPGSWIAHSEARERKLADIYLSPPELIGPECNEVRRVGREWMLRSVIFRRFPILSLSEKCVEHGCHAAERPYLLLELMIRT
jgi:hypothetical protein